MAIFKPKAWKNVNFLTFWTFRFYNLQGCFLVLEYRKRHFPGLYCLKKTSWKNGHFWTKTMGYPLWKNVNFSTFWTLCFYSLERCFLVLECRKTHFPGLYCLKKKVGKMAFFGPKVWVNPLEKSEFFDFFNFSFL